MANASTGDGRLRRLTSMDRHELFDRLRQHLTARADLLRYGIGHDFAGDPQVGPAGPEGRFFFPPTEVPSLCALLKQVFPSQADDIVFRAEKICRHRFDLVSYENLDYGVEIDWHSRRARQARSAQTLVQGKVSRLRGGWRLKDYLELNRHQHFVTLAKAYWLTGDDKFAREIFAQWTHWHKENPYP